MYFFNTTYNLLTCMNEQFSSMAKYQSSVISSHTTWSYINLDLRSLQNNDPYFQSALFKVYFTLLLCFTKPCF